METITNEATPNLSRDDNSLANITKLAATQPMPSYAIDDQTAIKVVGGEIAVVSEGNWRFFD